MTPYQQITPRPVEGALAIWAGRMRAEGMRPATVTLRTGVIRAMYRRAGVALVDDLGEDQAHAFLGREGLSANSRRVYGVTWRLWCRHIGTSSTLPIPRVPRGLPRPARAAQLAAAQLAAPPPVAAWIACGRWAGLRAAEVAGLRAEDVDLVAGVLYIDGKGGQRAALDLDVRLGAVLAPFVDAAGGSGRMWSVTSKTVSGKAGRLLRAHGAATRFHQLRHFYGTAIYQGTGDLMKAQHALRHASPTTTTIYARMADGALRDAIAMVP